MLPSILRRHRPRWLHCTGPILSHMHIHYVDTISTPDAVWFLDKIVQWSSVAVAWMVWAQNKCGARGLRPLRSSSCTFVCFLRCWFPRSLLCPVPNEDAVLSCCWTCRLDSREWPPSWWRPSSHWPLRSESLSASELPRATTRTAKARLSSKACSTRFLLESWSTWLWWTWSHTTFSESAWRATGDCKRCATRPCSPAPLPCPLWPSGPESSTVSCHPLYDFKIHRLIVRGDHVWTKALKTAEMRTIEVWVSGSCSSTTPRGETVKHERSRISCGADHRRWRRRRASNIHPATSTVASIGKIEWPTGLAVNVSRSSPSGGLILWSALQQLIVMTCSRVLCVTTNHPSKCKSLK